MKETISLLTRREVAFTSLRVAQDVINDGISLHPKAETLIAYSLDRLVAFERGEGVIVDFRAIAALSPEALGIPAWLDVGLRYKTNISLSAALKKRLNSFTAHLSRQFGGTCYRNFGLALAYRFVVLNDIGSVPILCGEELCFSTGFLDDIEIDLFPNATAEELENDFETLLPSNLSD